MNKKKENNTGQTKQDRVKYVPTPIMDRKRWYEIDRLDKAHSIDQERVKTKLSTKV